MSGVLLLCFEGMTSRETAEVNCASSDLEAFSQQVIHMPRRGRECVNR